MNIALVDDKTEQTEELYTLLQKQVGNGISVDCFRSGEAFLSSWKAGLYDLIILDIFMEKLTGIEVAKRIRESDSTVKLAFCTSSNEFASESYEVGACYYLHKPLDGNKIALMLSRLDMESLERLRTVTLPDGNALILRDVIYADSAAHYITFHLKRGKETVSRIPFSKLEPLLCEYPYFFSPSKGILVNFHEITSQTADTVRMSDGTVLPISRRKAKSMADAYSSFRFTKLRKDGDS